MRGIEPDDDESSTRGAIRDSMKAMLKKNVEEIKESAIEFTKQAEIVSTIPEKIMNLKIV